ncbi:hypothetical protein [Shewanella nanhaiensis]|uniref:DUF1579 domain-containing protein n=1 Tax=Shewanella nanhaiensis TaxID=2864872 RepID=A0ABS7E6G1_9GAMM|nr:hypothetical protein [Shewanella nanhaiensis]
MILSCFKYGLLCCLFLCFPMTSWAERANFNEFCSALDGQWQGSSAKPKQKPVQTKINANCSDDRRQLIFTVNPSAKHPLSETWWFRARGEAISLIYFDGVDEDKSQLFSLYHHQGSYSLLGEGELNSRPAMIQLRFDQKEVGWLWLQNIQYLDDDTDSYLFYRGIEMLPAAEQ